MSELHEYKVQRKIIAWEEQTVEAESFEQAIELADNAGDWEEVYDQYQETETYWVQDQITDVAKTFTDGSWESAI